MSTEPRQLLFVVLFFVGFFAFTIAEAYWLHRKKGVTAGRAFGFSFASNIFAITVGLFFSLITFVGIVAISRGEGSLEVTPNAAMVATAFVVSYLVCVAVLTLAKWLLLRFFRITSVEHPWGYSLLASIGFFVSVLILPFLIEYLSVR